RPRPDSHRLRDHAAGQACAGVAGGLAGVVVGIGVHDHAAVEDVGRRAVGQGGAVKPRVDGGHAGVVGNDVVGVADVVLAVADAAVGHARGIEVTARTAAI